LSIASSKLKAEDAVSKGSEMDSVDRTHAFGLMVGSPMVCYQEQGAKSKENMRSMGHGKLGESREGRMMEVRATPTGSRGK
jgi:hypothetical protein